jgi:hypothetical protein
MDSRLFHLQQIGTCISIKHMSSKARPMLSSGLSLTTIILYQRGKQNQSHMCPLIQKRNMSAHLDRQRSARLHISYTSQSLESGHPKSQKSNKITYILTVHTVEKWDEAL